jgi:hypothetical protein
MEKKAPETLGLFDPGWQVLQCPGSFVTFKN